ncbi:MAG: transposase [Thermoguttaceae bacterium]|nr:transposase [Thermoguttaceae bacterium]
MRLTEKQYPKIESLLTTARGNVRADNLTFLNSIFYVAENGYKWRALPSCYGPWNTVYRRFRRRAENGVLSRVQEVLQKEELIGADFSVLSLDSTFVKASPCAAGALKKRAASDRADEGRAHDQDSCDRRRPDDAGRAKTHAWERQRRARRSRTSPKS